MWQKMQTYIFVTIITVLIWLYAEGSTLQKRPLHREIEFVAPTGLELLIDPARPQQTVKLVVRGPIGQLDELERSLGERRIEIEVTVGSDSDDPQEKVDMHARLSAYLADVAPGVTLIDVTPTELSIRVERYVTRKLPIVLDVEGDVQVEQREIDPVEAEVRMPASLLAKLGEDAKVRALLTKAVLGKSEMGRERNAPVRLEPPLAQESGVTVVPRTANVTFKITQTIDSHTLTTIILKITKPLLAEGRYVVDVLDGEEGSSPVREIEIEGPTEIIEKIKTGQENVEAELDLTLDELVKATEKEKRKVVTFRSPPGVTVLTSPPSIRYKVTRATEPGTQSP